MKSDIVLERSLRAVARGRAFGQSFYGQFIGTDGRAADGTATLEIPGEPQGVGSPTVSVVALAVFVDLALGGAIRSRLHGSARPATISLSIQHPDPVVSGPLLSTATVTQMAAGFASSSCSIRSAGEVIGSADGWFATPDAPNGIALRRAPWELDQPPEVQLPPLGALDPSETAAIEAAQVAGQRASRSNTPVSEELLPFVWTDMAAGRVAGTLTLGPVQANRVGHVQGGIVYGAAAMSATRALQGADVVLRSGHYQFLRPSDGSVLSSEAVVTRRGNSVAFVETRMSVDGRQVGVGLFAFRIAGGAAIRHRAGRHALTAR